MADNKQATALVIHSFAVAHAATAALLAQTVIGDEAALTALTGSMIVTIVKMNGKHWTIGKALKFLGLFIGQYAGTRGAAFLIKWIPGIGNAANAITTFTITEVLGWTTYAFVSSGNDDFDSMSKSERDNLWKQAQKMREDEAAKSKKLYDSMSDEDKRAYDAAMKELRNKDISDTRRDELTDEINRIASKYAS